MEALGGILFLIILFTPLPEALAERIRKSGMSKGKLKSAVRETLQSPEYIELVQKTIKNSEASDSQKQQILEEAAMKLLSDDEFAGKIFDKKLKEK